MTSKSPSSENGSPIAQTGLDKAVADLASEFVSHPGFMWTDSGFEVLHADWPAYPRGHGLEICLQSLVEYPTDTRFFPIDNIDWCTLFVVGEKPKEDRFGSQHLHVAVWDEDIRECAARGFIEGVRTDDEFLDFPRDFLEVTPEGRRAALIDLLLGSMAGVLGRQILDFLYDTQYDSAVREASIMVEMQLRRLSASSDHGRRLIEKCFGKAGVLVPNGMTNANRLLVLNTFTAYFKYVRNEYAHSLPTLDMLTAAVLIRRSAALLTAIHALESQLQTEGSKTP
jgi:hypothetical protein